MSCRRHSLVLSLLRSYSQPPQQASLAPSAAASCPEEPWRQHPAHGSSGRASVHPAGSGQGLGTPAALLWRDSQAVPGAAEPEEARGGTWGEPGERGAPGQGWQVAPQGQVEQVGFQFLRARVCCAFVVTMTALLGQSAALGCASRRRKRKPWGGCAWCRARGAGRSGRDPVVWCADTALGTFLLPFPVKVRMLPGCLLPRGA